MTANEPVNHIASVALSGILTREAARLLHGRIFAFISRTTPLPEGMLESEIDQLMLSIRAASRPAVGEDAVDLAALLHDNDFQWDDANAVMAVLAHHNLTVQLSARPADGEFPDHTHRWQERSQEALDAEYSETGALLGRWYCPGCFTETDVEPDSVIASRAAIGVAAHRRRVVLGSHEGPRLDG